ncbi:MAG: pyridoxine 5'-phosphate synthase [Candidatus Omnitrophica bacterium]|nr:pyridoxine 5'-phosphate synthase [Candidatus Omnitrophota bacterium]
MALCKLGVNIDHIATVREARKTFEPDPVLAALMAEEAGCDGIVCHLRKDRRHINDKDLQNLKKAVTTRLNLEMSIDPEIVEIACRTRSHQATIVPENRQEITTEGGLDVISQLNKITEVVERLKGEGILTSLFIDPTKEQIIASKKTGCEMIEFHTGVYAEIFNSGKDYFEELENLKYMTQFAISEGLVACAGHGLNYSNVTHVAEIENMHELNIGHSIISRALFVGIKEAVREMRGLMGIL